MVGRNKAGRIIPMESMVNLEFYGAYFHSDKPRHPRQKYILTPKGYALLNEMRNRVHKDEAPILQ